MLHQANQSLPTSTSWRYTSEGGKHAVFSYQPNHTTEIREEWIGRLLRIDKNVFRQCVGVSTYVNNESNQSLLVPTTTTISNDNDPFRKMICTILQPYVDLPKTVILDSAYICSLRDIALASGRIPSRRRSDWLPTGGTATELENDHSSSLYSALVLTDYRLSTSSQQQLKQSKEFSICFEIKPKCGYITTSPCIDECHTYKYLQSRYVLLQNLYRTGKVTKDWMHIKNNDTFECSKYDPIDLFSCNESRIRRSLRCLVECPQNNLRIWNEEKLLVGLGPTNDATSFNWQGFMELMGIKPLSDSTKVDVIDFLIEVTVQVLLDEPFLSRVLSLQKLDILDTDGAARVQNRLVQLFNSNQSDAETLVDSHFEWAVKRYDDTCNTSYLLKHCPFVPPKDHSNVAKLCEHADELTNLLKKTNGTLPSTEQLSTIRTKANSTLDSLSTEECCYLLQTWLLALTMCDLSFFIHYTIETTCRDKQEHADFDPDSNNIKVIAKQTLDKPGRIAIRSSNRGKVVVLLYSLKVIDVDRKPASKLRSRLLKERQFDALIT